MDHEADRRAVIILRMARAARRRTRQRNSPRRIVRPPNAFDEIVLDQGCLADPRGVDQFGEAPRKVVAVPINQRPFSATGNRPVPTG